MVDISLENNLKEETFMTRLFIERDELKIKINKLDSFRNSSDFKKLDSENKSLLKKQFKLMNKYLDILNERINLLKAEG